MPSEKLFILARAHPRAIQILELFLLKLLAVVKCSRASSGLCAFMNLSPSMKCLSAHCFSWSYRTLLHTRNQPLVVQPQRVERTKQTVRIQRITLVQSQILAHQVSKSRIRKVLLILSQEMSREVSILLIDLPISRSNLHLIIRYPRSKIPLKLGLLILESQLVIFFLILQDHAPDLRNYLRTQTYLLEIANVSENRKFLFLHSLCTYLPNRNRK